MNNASRRVRRAAGLLVGLTSLGSALFALGLLPATSRLVLAADRGAFTEPGPPSVISLTLPISLPVGGAQGVVAAIVVDADGRFVADGTAVLLDTSLGRLGQASLTTVAGAISTSLTSDRLAGPAEVTAHAGEVYTSGLVVFVAGPPGSISLSPDTSDVDVGEPVVISISVVDGFGNVVVDGTAVDLTPDRGEVTPTVASTILGAAEAVWSSTVAGTSTITATAGAASATASKVFEPGPAARMHLRVDRPALPVVDGETRVRAQLSDRFGNVPDKEQSVHFGADGGELSDSKVDTVAGAAETFFSAGPLPGTFTVTGKVGRIRAEHGIELLPADLAIVEGDVHGPSGADTQIHPGETMSYTVSVSNQGLATAREVVLGSELPTTLEISAVTSTLPIQVTEIIPPGLLGPPGEGHAQRAWILPDLASGDGVTLTLSGGLDPDFAWTGFDSLYFRSALTNTTAEATTVDLTRTTTAHVYASDLYVTMDLDAEASALRAGGNLVYEVSFGNLKPQTDVGAVRITFKLPEFATYDHWQPGPGVVLSPKGPFDSTARELVWETTSPFGLTPGLRLWLAIDVDTPPESVLESDVHIESPVHDIRNDNNSYSERVRLRGVNLVARLDGPETAYPGAEIEYLIKITNAARLDTAHEVEVISALPRDLELVTTDPLGLVLFDGSIRWQLDTLGPTAVRRFEVVAKVPDTATVGEFYRHRVEVTSSDLESDKPDNSAESWTQIVPGPPAAISVSAESQSITACTGESTALTASVTDRVGNPVADGTGVKWTATEGSISTFDTTTTDGRSSVTLHAGRRSGSARVAASTDDTMGAAFVKLVPDRPASLSVSVDPYQVRRGASTVVTVNSLDGCSNEVSDGWQIQLMAERGSFGRSGPSISLPTVQGRVSALLTVGQEPGPLRVVAAFDAVKGEAVVSVMERSIYELYMPYVLR